MVKRLTLLLILLAGSAGATVVTTASSGNMSALSFTANDTLIVANGHTLTVDTAYSTTAPVIRMVFVRSGGTLTWTSGKGFGCNALVQGNRASAPFSSTNGGRVVGATTGYLHTYHDAAFTYDWEVGAGADVLINVNAGLNGVNAFVINGKTSACRFYALATADSLQIAGARFSQYYNSSLAQGGVQINASGRTGFTQVRRSYFDTSNFTYVSATSLKIDTCYFWVSTTVGRAIHFWTGASNGVYGCQINVDAGGGAQGAVGIYAYNCDGCQFSANYIRDYNSTAFAGTYGILLDGATSTVRISRDTLIGFGFTVGTAVGTANRAITIDSCWIYGNDDTHELIIKHDGDRAWRIAANQMFFHSGGGRSAVLNYCSSTPSDSCDYLYNTINATYGGGPASSALAWEHTATGSLTYLGDRVVGNVLIGNNSGFGFAEAIVGTTASQTVALNLREWKYNAYDSVYVTSGSSVTYPYTYSDSNKNNATAFDFVDSLNADMRLNSTSPMINCGDSTFGISAFGSAQASKTPFDIGYYQSYTTGTCGGSSTPTGACCIAYTCYPGYTSAQCTSQGGTYQGDGTTTCTNCTAPQTGIGTGYGKRSWMSLATLTYGGTLTSYASIIGRKFDLIVNAGDAFKTALEATDPNVGQISYLTISTLRGSDSTNWAAFAASRGYNYDSGFIWAAGGSNCLNSIAPSGAPCTGATTCTSPGAKMSFCSFNTYRNWPNMRYVGMQQFTIYKVLQGSYNKGIMQDEATFFFQDTLTHYGTNSQWFPADINYWVSGSAAQTNAWVGSGLTHIQIEDSLIRIKRNTWLAELMDSLSAHGKQTYSNGAAYAQERSDLVGDAAILGSGLLFGEGMDMAMHNATSSAYPAMTWRIMDSLRTGGRNWQNSNAIIWLHIDVTDTLAMAAVDGTTAMKSRLAQERYAWYMMAQTPLKTFLFIALNWGGNAHINGWTGLSGTDSLFKFCPSMDAPLGAPSGIRSVLSQGTGGIVYQRSYTNGKVLWRDGTGGNLGAAGAITVALGATYYPVNYDGTYGTPTSTASIRNGEGLVFITSTSSATGTLSIDNPTTPEGSNMVFTVTLSPAQTVPVSVNYITSPGSGAAITDYTDQSGTISFGIGQTTATISIPTVDRAGCLPSRTFNVTLYGASPGTSITIPSPTATGTITDGDCGTTYGKTYKGKIVIKGKVRP